ncbi:hypothetical protein quinque_000618 [Culex quinquefasciatus]
MFNGRFVVGWLGLLVLTGYVQSAIPLGQLGRASSKALTCVTELPIVEDPIPECFSVSEADCGAYYDCNGEAHWERCLEGYIYYPKLRSCLPGNVETYI